MTQRVATDPIPLAQALIRCRSVTPTDDGALEVVQRALEPLGFACTRLVFGPDDYRVDNLFARRGSTGPHLCYAGHTDVVPPGDVAAWTDDPFSGAVRDGVLYGRGACDMKGGIAAFIAGLADYLAGRPDHPGSISLLITGDEEARSVDGTARVLEWMQAEGHIPDMALVGEPTSKARLGDTIKIGRRGSLTARIAVQGKQGHSAYPALADNPIHRLVAALGPLLAAPLDHGSEFFPPTTLQVTGFDVGNTASNVIPACARAMLNIRFNDLHDSAALTQRLHAALQAAGCRYDMVAECSGESFLTRPGPFVDALSRAIAASTGVTPALDTGGGTSDARFIARYCPVAEFGAVGATLHQVNENAPVAELRALAATYRAILHEVLG
ncbi:succinyl-diaminopimelate desuccinylase [Roseomonas sp. CECT 9278]|uniref:succinyl-diaminopimelate desuccinylase n=1 Tax=Roseomonas sp. CECT 9278 TaxID=2845823 RepID=UPI001E50B507|nr:succinyl-diaminopimelate desuccinylase [Roseomonas sp. CECT 9278]CAH0149002.1 Succinyl-diaminopimelate desuccinylase [Roseomonas sp. CECT 9278]